MPGVLILTLSAQLPVRSLVTFRSVASTAEYIRFCESTHEKTFTFCSVNIA